MYAHVFDGLLVLMVIAVIAFAALVVTRLFRGQR